MARNQPNRSRLDLAVSFCPPRKTSPASRYVPSPALGGPVRDIAPAWGAEVVSSNIVGYEKLTLTPGFNMIGNQFLAVGGDSFQNINEMFKDSSQLTPGGAADEADSILVWDGSNYSNVYYYDDWDNHWYNTDDIDNATTTVIGPGKPESGTNGMATPMPRRFSPERFPWTTRFP